jgi:hypothetical protein
MAYRITLDISGQSYTELADVLIWCHNNMCIDKDWQYSDEVVNIHGVEVNRPTYLFLNNEEDLLALTLAVPFVHKR